MKYQENRRTARKGNIAHRLQYTNNAVFHLPYTFMCLNHDTQHPPDVLDHYVENVFAECLHIDDN